MSSNALGPLRNDVLKLPKECLPQKRLYKNAVIPQ